MSSPTYEQRMQHPRRCQAHRTNGDPCGAYAIAGGSVCRVHGGAAPQAKRKARQRLEEAALRMAERVLGIAEDDGVPPAVALAAAKDALDRAGLKPPTTVELNPGEPAPWQRMATGIVRMSREESRARRGLAPEPLALPVGDDSEPLDAEVVDPPPDEPQPAPPWAAPPAPRPGTGMMTMEQAAAETAVIRAQQSAAMRASRGSRRIKSSRAGPGNG